MQMRRWRKMSGYRQSGWRRSAARSSRVQSKRHRMATHRGSHNFNLQPLVNVSGIHRPPPHCLSLLLHAGKLEICKGLTPCARWHQIKGHNFFLQLHGGFLGSEGARTATGLFFFLKIIYGAFWLDEGEWSDMLCPHLIGQRAKG